MARRWTQIAIVAAVVAASLVWSGAAQRAEPPTSRTTGHTVSTWNAAGEGWSTSRVLDTPDTVLVGAEWAGSEVVEVRSRTADGWGAWVPLERHADHGDGDRDHGEHREGDAEAAGSEPVWTGRTDAVQLRASGEPTVELTTVRMSGPDGLAYSPLTASGPAAHAQEPGRVVPRSAWDPAGECRPREQPEYLADVEVGVVHHTHIFPHYTPEEADDLIRAVCLFHVRDRGFQDVAYNLLIDHYGVVYEGRAGGADRPVKGAHAAGFNDASFGVAVLGDFEAHDVPDAAVDALDRVLAWKFSLHGIDPHGRSEVVSTGGHQAGLTAFPAGTAVSLPSIIGHRDTASNSLCPGRYLYARLEGATDRVAALMAEGVNLQVADSPAVGRGSGIVPVGPGGGPSGSVGLMAAPPPIPELPGGRAPSPLVGLASVGLAGLAIVGRRRARHRREAVR